MKPASQALVNLLATGRFCVADLYTFTLISGTVLRYTTADVDILAGGHTWSAQGPRIEGAGGRKAVAHWRVGVDVDTLQFDVFPRATDPVLGLTFLEAVVFGAFDGAEVAWERAYMASWGDVSAGTISLFVGRVAEIDAGRSVATFNVNSHLELLNTQLPRDVYQPGCPNTLFDLSCTLTAASFAVAGTVGLGSTAGAINAALGQATGYFDLGKMQVTSGPNSGLWRSVKSFASGGTVTLLAPFPFTPGLGDTFTLYPGCDKTQATCTAKFNNLANFRGQPYVPQPENAI